MFNFHCIFIKKMTFIKEAYYVFLKYWLENMTETGFCYNSTAFFKKKKLVMGNKVNADVKTKNKQGKICWKKKNSLILFICGLL